ncbi:hypothetical protein GCM10023189_32860 [Nibrella saemangeumensis]|uniref:JAB domain-containing protein n=1 Tax=Nibrella saemangeumensis TaxID=1084526 RepID=A0ABP8N484_9BACT
MAGCRKINNYSVRGKAFTPVDSIQYLISNEVVATTQTVLKEYSHLQPASEGIVYWAGKKLENTCLITAVIAPDAMATPFNITIGHQANAKVVEFLCDTGLIHLGQVHTHPGKWVGHSLTDDRAAAFKCQGLLSIVVPDFCTNTMLPLIKCGIHRYENDAFMRLSKTYVNKHFAVTENSLEFVFQDFRVDYYEQVRLVNQA